MYNVHRTQTVCSCTPLIRAILDYAVRYKFHICMYMYAMAEESKPVLPKFDQIQLLFCL